MKNENSRNTVIFIVATLAILILYQMFVMQPQAERQKAAQLAEAAQTTTAPTGATGGPEGPSTAPTTSSAIFTTDRTQALATAARVPIDTPRVQGSLSLLGGRIDDLFLKNYRETIDADAPLVELFRPLGMEHAYFAQFGWRGANVAGGVPGPNTLWRLTEGTTLTPATPVTLTFDNGQGLRFTRRIAIDENYLFTVTDTVANLGTQPITIAPYGRVERHGVPADLGKQQILHEGGIGTFGENGGYTTKQLKYGSWADNPNQSFSSTGGWLGITDKYWMAALIPPQDEAIEAEFTIANGRESTHEARLLGAERTVQPGRQIVETNHLFAGAKRNEILEIYERQLDLPRFVYAIDWGFLFFLTRPIFLITDFFYGLVGNFGVAILLLTAVIKLIMFPLANKSYESLSKMRLLQPKMEEIKKKYKDDPQAQQKEMMGLYQKEKINPLAGCLPILIQIPVFYALYKVLFVTIEMRHAPFFGWLRDLSAPDPSTLWNLYGLVPWDPATVPVIGTFLAGTFALSILAIFYGLTMWLQTAMNPPATDPVQRQIFALMPIVFTFIMATFPAGLLVYWAWNNILSIIQQWFIMHRFGAENPIDNVLARFRKAPA